MNFRALNIREAHERPEAMEEASVMLVGLNPERILQGLVQLQYQQPGPRSTSHQSPITNHQNHSLADIRRYKSQISANQQET
jgi:UDP-N-acetylglucosamine 2-epimerase